MSVLHWIYILTALLALLVKVHGVTLCSSPCLLVSNTTDIVTMDIKTSAVNSVVVGLTRAVAIDVHFSLGYIFWSDVIERSIKRLHIDTNTTTTIISNIGVCDGLAVHWRNSKLFWSDTTTNTISVSDLDGNNQLAIISFGLDEPRGIALDPDNNLMFWTDLGLYPKIERATLSGNQRTSIVTKNLYHPNGLDLDKGNQRIFWVDAGLDRVESIDYNGGNRKLLFQQSGLHPFGITLVPPFLFFTDWHASREVHKLDALTGEVFRSYNINGGQPMGIVAYDGLRQPSASSPCSVNNGGCSHFCVPKPSGHECKCPTGLAVRQNGRTCEEKVKKFLLYTDADDKSTNIISLDVNYMVSKTLFKHLGDHRPIALDFDPVENRVYWTDVRQGRIMSAFRNASSAKTLYYCNVLNPDGLAIDHVGRNIYWTDTGTDRIELGRLDGSKRKVLFKDGLDEPRAIVLDGRNGMMYWTDWGAHPKIEKAEMDGSGRQSIVTGNLAWPNGLSIDQATNRLYWVDARLDTIEMTDLNGGNRRLLLSSADQIHPFGLALYENVLYWTDWNKKSILRYNLTSAKHETVIPDLQKPMDIHVYDPSLSFSGPHACTQNNGFCSDFCLLKPGGYKCACPTGISLKPDGRSCDDDTFDNANSKKFMIFAEANTREIYSVAISVSENPCKPLQIKANISSPLAVDYDPFEGRIYWTDAALKIVARAFPNGSSVEVIAYNNVQGPEGLAVDYIQRNLYWTDAGTRKIEVARLDGSSRRGLITSSIESPTAIILNIAERKMFWSDQGLFPKIEQANMDGSARAVLVNSGLVGVNSLAIDYSGKLLYWCDANLDKIERVDFQGNNRVVILDLSSDTRHPFGLALSDDVLYWSDLEKKNINKYNMTSSRSEVLVHGMGSPKELHIHDNGKTFSESTSCSHLNGGCSHLCLPNPSGHQCFCSEGILLKPGDPLTCQGVTRCAILSVPSNGTLKPCSNLPGNTCQFSCDKGYILSGSATRTCRNDGTWTGTHTQCNAATCPALPTPANGIQTGCTGKTAEQHNTVCQFSCKSGFTAIGSPTRKCQENGTWSGQDFVCVAITCPALPIPRHGQKVGCHDPISEPYNAQCWFSCQASYNLIGSSVRRCLMNGTWSGVVPSCRGISCDPLVPHKNMVISPSSCLSSSSHGQICRFSCRNPGYILDGAPSKVCDKNGKWTGSNDTRCRDIQHPRLQCPLDIVVPTDTDQSYANVTWEVPVPTDNSREHLILTGLTPPQQFNVGTNHITYKVTDSSALSSSCTFSIQVKDKEPPRISSCPDNILITTAKRWTKVWLPGVRVTDNVGVHIFITSSPNGSEFTWGQHNITYSAIDTAGNTAMCKFRITIKDHECPKLHSPLNGAKACDLWLDSGKICTLHCNAGYDFANKPPEFYFCGALGRGWLPHDKIPDCSATRQPKTLLKIQLHYLADQCNEGLHGQIASSFIALYTTYLRTDKGCDSLELCTIENVEVECGDQTGTLRKRDLESDQLSSRIPLSVTFDLELPLPRNTSVVDLNQTTEKISNDLLVNFNRTDANLNVSGISIMFDASKPPQVRFVRLLCDSGQVLRGSKCVSCPVGYFHNTSGCQACAVDHYQDKEAQTSCVPCPSGTSTSGALASKWRENCTENLKTSDRYEKDRSGPPLSAIIAIAIAVPVIVIVGVGIFFVRKQRIAKARGTAGAKGHANPVYEDPTSNNRTYDEIEELQFPSPYSHYQSLNTNHIYAALRNSHSEA